MRALPVTATDTSAPAKANYRLVRISCWFVLLVFGAAQAWATRFSMNPDGVSYLDIGDAYWRGDWHTAINAYWSPLYSWILGFFLKLLKPSTYWEYPLVHFVNFLIYVATLACFEFFLATFIADRKQRDKELLKDGLVGLPRSSWWLLGYSLFLSSSIILIGLRFATPDMCVAAFVYLAAALLLKIRAGPATRGTYLVFGLVLGLAYLAKAVMFPLGFVFLFGAWLARRSRSPSLALAAITFVAIATPFIFVISRAGGHVTIGESGRWNYLVFVDGIPPFFPAAELAAERPGGIREMPNILEFKPVGGTYAPWYDPSYWQRGIKMHLNSGNQLLTVLRGISAYWHLASSTSLQFAFTIGLVIVGAALRVRTSGRPDVVWPILVPVVAALAIYALLIVEYRYVGAFVLLVWVLLFNSLKIPATPEAQNLVRFTIVCVCVISSLPPLLSVNIDFRQDRGAAYWEAARALSDRGFREGDSIALVWDEDWQTGAAEGSFVPRLLKARVVAEAEPARTFWNQTSTAQQAVLRILFASGATVIIARRIPANADEKTCWQRLGNTEYYACFR